MPRNHYAGFTTRYSERYKNMSASKATNKHGSTYCTKCKCDTSIELDGEHMQRGLIWNKYFEFNHCLNCGYRFCIVMLRKDDDYND